jgi:hypothetical protein
MAEETPHTNGRLRWAWWFEWVVVPLTGLSLLIYGALGGGLPAAYLPVVVGLVAFPFARQVDRLRRGE